MAEESVYILYDFDLDKTGMFADILLDVKQYPPPGFHVDYPHPTAAISQGEIWSNIVKPCLKSAGRIVAFVDLPNANVGFEIGYTLGQAQPTRVALALQGREIPHWLQQPPFQGFSCTPLTTPSALKAQIISDTNWFAFDRRPQPGQQVLFLCPPSGGGEAYLRRVHEHCRWKVLPTGGWSFHELPEHLNGVGAVVWLLLPHGEGAVARDGTDNTALAVIAGYAEGCGIPVHVFVHHNARMVVDVMARARPLSGLPAFEEVLPPLAQELEDALRPPQEPVATLRPPGAAYRAYYEDCVTRWSGERYALDTSFVQLTLLLDQGPDTQGPRWQSTSEKFRDLHAVLARISDPAVVVLGPPGSGKSTLLRHYEMDVANAALAADGAGSEAPLTFFVPLNDYKPARLGEALPLPMDWLAARWGKHHADLPTLEILLRERRLTLLLDALNEMPGANDPAVMDLWHTWIRELAQDYPGNRMLFSCRSLDYGQTLSSDELPVPQVRIESLSPDQVQEFIMAYCPEWGATLWQHLRGTPQLELLRSPYYLKLLVQQSTDGHIPRGRAALFTGFVWHALRREVERNHPLFHPDMLEARDRRRLIQDGQPPPSDLPERGLLLPRLSTLAWQMQHRGVGQEATQVRVAYDEAVAILGHPRAADILAAGEALAILEEDLRQDEVLYVHQLLQEYFAARRLAREPQPALVQQLWRAAEVVPDLQAKLATLADSDPLPPLDSTGWEETTVLAAAMASQPDAFVVALMEANLPLAGRCAAQPEVQVSEALKAQIRQALVQRTQDPAADLRARIAAGLALGVLGDPRFVRRQGPHGDYLLPPMIDIPRGTYRIGSDEGHYADEAPVHEVVLAPFALGQFPVTNAEWALFMQAGGYEEERWWETGAAQAWRRGEGTAEGAKQQRRDDRKYVQEHLDEIRQLPQQGRMTSKQLEDWEAMVDMSEEDFETLLDTRYPPGRQTQPAQWNDDAFSNPAQPVVGICWFEARAYCSWLSAQTGATFRLPTEAEWEAGARGQQGRRYAFGDDFDVTRCNTFETHIRHTTPIGVFPGGETPEGLVDMTGNTWDWTSGLFVDYPYDAVDSREDVNAVSPARRVVRGGSWDRAPLYARASYRGDHAPGHRHDGVGLRLVRAVPSS